MDIKEIAKKAEENAKKIENNMVKIHQNTGALEILKTFKSDSNKFFAMWLITFIVLVGCVVYIIFR